MHCKSTTLTTALAAWFMFSPSTLASHLGRAKRHASIQSAFSQRHRVKRQDFLSTTQPSNLAQGSATADEGCTLWIQPWDGASCLAIITYSPGLILEDFIELNPSVDIGCSNLESNLNYCIDTDDSHEESSSNSGVNNAVKQKTCGASKKPSAVASSTKDIASATATTIKSTTTRKPSKVVGAINGLLQFDDPVCGKADSTRETTKEGGPNGRVSFLNCGISTSDKTSPWTPPKLKLSDIVYQNMSTTGVYAPCAPYLPLFKKAEEQYGIPAIMSAALAMQESTCNPDASGDEGWAYGLMQITRDKCGDAPGGNCNDPEYNVMTGVKYLYDVLNGQCDQDIVCTIGQYNGWNPGMTYDSATAQRYSCCVCQNNLDYLHQFFNAWIQNLNGLDYTPYDNLRPCETWWNGKK